MTEPSRYEIEIRGRATDRVLHPAIDEFRIEPTGYGTTRLVGEIRDPSHLNGLLAHFTSMNVEVVGLRRLGPTAAGGTADRCRPLSRPLHPSHPSPPTHPDHEEGTTP